MARRRDRPRCPKTRKTQFDTYEKAAKVAARVDNEARVYRCTACGYFHMTSIDRASYDRRQAEGRASSQQPEEVADGAS